MKETRRRARISGANGPEVDFVHRLSAPAYLKDIDHRVVVANHAGGEILMLHVSVEDEREVFESGHPKIVDHGDGVSALLTRLLLNDKEHVLAIGTNPLEASSASHLGFTLDGVCGAFRNGELFSVNEGFAAILNKSQGDLLGTNFRDYLHLTDRRTLRSIYRRMQVNGKAESAIRMVRPDGAEITVWLTMLERADGGFFASIRDITQQRRFERQLEETFKRLHATQVELEDANAKLTVLATTDGLTGLVNHLEFQNRLAQEIDLVERHGGDLAVVMLDVDRFKLYNDTYGHPAGDVILKTVARILDDEARRSDTVARYGGEEFALLLPSTNMDGALDLAERIRSAIQSKFWPQLAITASFGVASYAEFPSEMVEAADRALYQSKEGGRNRVSRAVS